MKKRAQKRGAARRPNWLKVLGIALGAGVVTFAIAYIITVRVIFPPLPEPEDGIVVPRLIGLTVPEAEAQLRALSLRVAEIEELAHPAQPAGVIIAQSPLPDQQLRELGGVRLAISAGPPRARIPNVVGFLAERARTTLGALGLEVEEQSEENELAAGRVFRVAPEPGAEVPVPSRIVLFVSTGPPPADTLPAPADSVPVTRTSE